MTEKEEKVAKYIQDIQKRAKVEQVLFSLNCKVLFFSAFLFF